MPIARRNIPIIVLLGIILFALYHVSRHSEDLTTGISKTHGHGDWNQEETHHDHDHDVDLSLMDSHPANENNKNSPANNNHDTSASTDKAKPPINPDDTSTTVETRIPGGELVNGFGLMDRLYLKDGTLFIVTTAASDRSIWPEPKKLIARPLDMKEGVNLDATDKELRIITPDEAKEILGDHAIPIKGFTIIAYDTEQFMNHFYHWWGEIILGAWRAYSALPAFVSGKATPPDPARIILPNIYGNEWRDVPAVNARLMRAGFPSTSIEKFDFWDDLASLGRAVVFERAMVVSRPAAHQNDLTNKWSKMMAPTMPLSVPTSFFEPIRSRIVSNLLSSCPSLDSAGHVTSPASQKTDKPIVTYISRQGGGRRLSEEAHNNLVSELKKLEHEGVAEVNVVQMEKLSLSEQVAAMAKTTIALAVHGNGLTHQLWMPPTPRSTVIEIFAPESYLFDYEMLARNVGRKHYAVWNDKLLTYEPGTYHDGINLTPDFQGTSIPVDAKVVADLVKKRLTEHV